MVHGHPYGMATMLLPEGGTPADWWGYANAPILLPSPVPPCACQPGLTSYRILRRARIPAHGICGGIRAPKCTQRCTAACFHISWCGLAKFPHPTPRSWAGGLPCCVSLASLAILSGARSPASPTTALRHDGWMPWRGPWTSGAGNIRGGEPAGWRVTSLLEITVAPGPPRG